ncbi:MAG: hypothetical protein GY875_10590 [Gammaproteobacteria bacterium]|nr:hypothetical protein [Gammaproteobacteria bacterium]
MIFTGQRKIVHATTIAFAAPKIADPAHFSRSFQLKAVKDVDVIKFSIVLAKPMIQLFSPWSGVPKE